MSEPNFEFQVVAVLVCTLLESGGKLGRPCYEMMSAVDGSRSYHSFEHQFRAVMKRAYVLKAMKASGEKLQPVTVKPRKTGEVNVGKKTASDAKGGASEKKRRQTKVKNGVEVYEDGLEEPNAKRARVEAGAVDET